MARTVPGRSAGLPELLTAAAIMTYPVEAVGPEAPVLYAIGILDRSGFSQLPVLDEASRPVGTFRARDVRRLYWQAGSQPLATQLADLKVGQVCSEPLPQVRPGAGLSEVISRVEKWHAVLVGPQESSPAWGIITASDLVRTSKPYLLLAELEVRLRSFIAERLATLYGRRWEERIPAEVRHRAKERQAAAQGLAPPGLVAEEESVLEFCSFGDYLEIVLTRENWGEAFAPVFGSREWVTRRLKDLQALRNAVAHHRRLTGEEIDLLDAYVEAFLRCLGTGSR